MRKQSRNTVGIVAGLLLIGALSELSSGAAAPGAPKPEYVPGEVIVRYRDKASERAMQRVRDTVGGTARARLARYDVSARLERLTLPSWLTVEQAITALEQEPLVKYAEPNFIYRHAAVPSDPRFDELWGLNNTGQSINGGLGGLVDADIDAPEAWDRNTGSPTVFVGVIDQGIDFNHPDLAGVVINPGEDANGDGVITSADINGIDNDGNGKIDDVRGWDFVSNDNSIYDPVSPADTTTDEHGTHVSGTIGAVGNNARGVAGVNWNVRIISGKFLGAAGGTTANAINAVDYFTDLKVNRGVNIVATSNSWGGGGFSQALQDAIDRANAAGILFVAAAGNDATNNDATPNYPSNYPSANVIAVASVDRFDALSGFSNYGATTVDVGAPGSTILSTTPGNTYSYFSGTSMATPHVTGLAALLKSDTPALTAAGIKSRILNTVVATPALAGRCLTGGRINAANALGVAPPPTPDFSIAASPASQTVSPGGSTTYTVTLTSQAGFSSAVTLSASGLPAGATAAFSPASVTPPAGGSATATLTVTTSATTPAGSSVLTVTGTSGALSHSTSVQLVVQSTTTDTVTITKAQWDSRKGLLQIEGTVSSNTATLTATFGGRTEPVTNNRGRFRAGFGGVTSNPGTVTVTSSGGGSATRTVTVK